MSEGATAQDSVLKSKEQAEEARYIREKETTQLTALREEAAKSSELTKDEVDTDHDFEGGFGGQEELEDRYATTSGEH